ncbi:MAG: DNA gyrase inhibitor YacG [Myxococcota bacterium]
MTSSDAMKCPSCKREVLSRPENPCFPFCSERCRAVDLGRWLGGEYRIAARSQDEDEDGDAAPERLTDA